MIRHTLYIAVIIALTCIAACTSVDTDTTPVGTTSKWVPAFNWNGVSTKPDSMLIIANRAINTYRYVYSWNIDKGLGYLMAESTDLGYKKTSIANDNDTTYNPTDTTETYAQQQAAGKAAEDNSRSDIELRPGEYTVMTASMNPGIIYTCLNQTGFQQFMDSTVSPREIAMYYKTLTADSVHSMFGKAWTDFNPAQKYIPDLGPLYFAEQKQLTIPTSMPTQFTLQDITQELTIHFNVHLIGAHVSISDIVGDISGIASNVRMSSLYINTGATRKMPFRADMNLGADSTISCTAKLTIPGIISTVDTTTLTGTGVLQLAIYAETIDSDGKTVKKTYYVSKNVNEEIREGEYSKLGDDNVHLVIAEHDITLNITTPIYIDRHTILTLPDNVSTLNRWIVDKEFEQQEDIEI